MTKLMMSDSKKNIEEIYELTPMQQGMLFHTILNGDTRNYFEQLTSKIMGHLNVPAFKDSWIKIINRYPVFRTSFVYKNLDKMYQVVHRSVDLPFSYFDWTDKSEEKQKIELEEFLASDRKKGFNLSKVPLLRVALFKVSEDTHRLIWSHHHILFDGWSIPIIFKDLITLYEAEVFDEKIYLEKPPPFSNYIKYLGENATNDEDSFWKTYLRGFREKTNLNLENSQSNNNISGYAKKTINLGENLSSSLYDVARTHKITINNLLQAGWALLLRNYSSNEDVIFGATFSGRPADLVGSDRMVGLFINTLPIRARFEPNERIINWIIRFVQKNNELREYEHSSLAEIQKSSELPAKENLFDSLYVFENYPIDEALETKNNSSLQIDEVNSIEETNYPLTIVSAPGKIIKIDAAYKVEKIDEYRIDNLLSHYRNVLDFIVKFPSKKISDVEYLSKDEKKSLLPNKYSVKNWNKPWSIIRLFEEIVVKFPQNVALRHDNNILTYTELNCRANILANILIEKEMGPEDFVAVYINRSFEMIISILAILKAGAGYVPIDTSSPIERIKYMISDSNSKLLITEEALRNRFESSELETIIIDSIDVRSTKNNDINPNIDISPDNVAYVIYTSGSTGKPKGTILQNRSVLNFINAFSDRIGISEESRVLQFASIGFDASIPEIFSPLLNGGCVQLTSNNLLENLSNFGDFIVSKNITLLHLPPSVLSSIPLIYSSSLKSVVSFGEKCPLDIVEKWSQHYAFFNGYGPTEASVGCLWGNKDKKTKTASFPIGYPISNVKIYVLDNYLNPVAKGIPGELYIGGIALARGYLGKPELTSSKFIPNPFSNVIGERIYRTGDLVKIIPDGQLEFLGRIDNQVKLRGFRVELEEIETILNENDSIRKSAVVLHGKDREKIVAFAVSQSDKSLDVSNILNELKSKMPPYMIPYHIEVIDEIPLNANAKIDRKKLETFNIIKITEAKFTEINLTASEELLVTLIKNVLGIESLSLKDNFFELGGHSLNATQLVSRIRESFKVDLAINKIFDVHSIQEIALEINKLKRSEGSSLDERITKYPRDKYLELSFAQKRMWFLQKFNENNLSNNIFNSFSIEGDLKINAFQNSINKIIDRHEILRTSYSDYDGKPIQKISSEFEYKILEIDLEELSTVSQKEKLNEIILKQSKKVFNLAKLPLFEITIIKISKSRHILLFTLHHIIADGWSVNILIHELSHYYKAEIKGKEADLPDLEIQYADFSIWQKSWLTGSNLEKQLSYWRRELEEIPEKIDLPIDKQRPLSQTFNGDQIEFEFDEILSSRFIELTKKSNLTPYMLSISALFILLYKYSNQETIVIGSPIANRNKKEIENLIGFFVNTVALRIDISGNDRIVDILKRVREKTLQAHLHQDLPFEKLVDDLNPQRDMSISPIFQVACVFENALSDRLKVHDLILEPYIHHTKLSKYDITQYIKQRDNKLFGTMEFNTDLFNHKTISRMVDHYLLVLNEIISNPNQKLSNFSILTKEEWSAFERSDDTKRETEIEQVSVPSVFYKTVEKHERNLALTFSEFENNTIYTEELNYQEVNQKTNQLANYLIKKGLDKEDFVAIVLPRSLDVVISMIATVKAGGAFIPIDPNYPSERINYMLENSDAKFIITYDNILELNNHFNAEVIELDKENDLIKSENDENVYIEIQSDNLAYAIYTSGSTGVPKGALLTHKGLVNLASVQKEEFNITNKQRILQFSALSFDAFVWETVMALLNGASLNIVSQQLISSHELLVKLIKGLEISLVTFPPSYLSVIPEFASSELETLKTIIVAGERCPKDLVDTWITNRRFINAYGPTETTVCASMHHCSANISSNPPIGKAIKGFGVYILDKYLNPLPVGIPGELYIAGIGIARGYHRLPQQTAEKFLPNPFVSKPGSLMYKSGDLVKLLPSGEVAFLGRIDNQVKFRGFRIELGEIESVISDYPQINNNVVLLRDDKNGPKSLAAYLVVSGESELVIGDLRSFLRRKLPDFMIPSSFIILDQFPVTPSNKIDIRALPAPSKENLSYTNEYVEPRDETEKKLSEIGKELLGIDKMGIHDNFFELGGHSLLATQFTSRIKTRLNKEVSLKTLFENPTVIELAEKLKSVSEILDNGENRISAEKRGEADLTELLDQLENMTDEEAKSLIEKDVNRKG